MEKKTENSSDNVKKQLGLISCFKNVGKMLRKDSKYLWALVVPFFVSAIISFFLKLNEKVLEGDFLFLIGLALSALLMKMVFFVPKAILKHRDQVFNISVFNLTIYLFLYLWFILLKAFNMANHMNLIVIFSVIYSLNILATMYNFGKSFLILSSLKNQEELKDKVDISEI